MAHRLDPLLRPKSIAVIGATERAHSVGRRIVHNLLAGHFDGKIFPVNPGRESVLGLQCYADLDSLPEQVDHVAFAVSDYRIEAALEAAIEHGAKAATIMSQLIIADDSKPDLQERIEARIHDSGLIVCGANGMGFYNCRDGVWMCGFDTRENHPRGGNVTLISHSGSGMSGIVDCEERIDFNLAVSTGQEINVGMHHYMDFAIEEHQPSAIGLFMETARDPEALMAVLEKARQRHIPVVAIKVGRTALSSRLAQSHSGAMAGQDEAFDALFDRFGVQRVYDMDALATTLIMFAQPHRPAPGGLVALHDSGGERQLLIDLADEMDVPLAKLSPSTIARLEQILDPGLPAVNPLDAWGAGGEHSDHIMGQCLAAMMQDESASIGAVVHDRAPYSQVYPEYVDYMRVARQHCEKPLFLMANRQGTGSSPDVVQVTREGFPVLDGLRSFLEGVRCLFGFRDHQRRAPEMLKELNASTTRALQASSGESARDEFAALAWLEMAGIPVVAARRASSLAESLKAARELGYPVALKTAEPGIAHKTNQRGVHLGLADESALKQAWLDLSTRLGEQVVVAEMAPPDGLELMLGMVTDLQFGPLVLMGFGGTRVEGIDDFVTLMPPFGPQTARRRLQDLQHHALLGHNRGSGKPHIDAFCETAALFSSVVASLQDELTEIDINPVIVHGGGCMAVDALIITRQRHNEVPNP
ncbi:MAG: acetate--CoA ligase family protein [Xanthomonadales bacterium]|nr:acetate--CoA ligase family protein [Xanthomonadales bacterium]NNL95497.1 acetate--CoA ligase family protein [Xanthomonadales bacterium]